MRVGDKRPGKNFGQPIGVVREGGGRVQPHTFLDSKKKYKAAYPRARVQNLSEQRRDKNCLESNHPAMHSKGGRFAEDARNIGKRGAKRASGSKR